MSNIIDDVVDEIVIKPKNTIKFVKWIIGISFTLIVGAYTIGNIVSNWTNKIESNTEDINNVKLKFEVYDAKFEMYDAKIENLKDKDTEIMYTLDKLVPALLKLNFNK